MSIRDMTLFAGSAAAGNLTLQLLTRQPYPYQPQTFPSVQIPDGKAIHVTGLRFTVNNIPFNAVFDSGDLIAARLDYHIALQANLTSFRKIQSKSAPPDAEIYHAPLNVLGLNAPPITTPYIVFAAL
jgi:hypothetical protein